MKTILALPAVLLLAGCATIGNSQDDEWQRLADRATAHFHATPVTVVPLTSRSGSTYVCRELRINLAIGSETRMILAHELGHHLLSHCGASQAHEREANAKAIQVLLVWGSSEVEAVRDFAERLLRVKRRIGNNERPGHNICGEVLDLIHRYPAVADPIPAGNTTCAVELAGRS
jgi:hypothetical protein